MNTLENLIPANLASAVGETFMHALWQLAGVAVLLLLTLLFVNRKAAAQRYRLGTIALGLMLALPIGTFFYVFEPAEAGTSISGAAFISSEVAEFGIFPVATSETTLLEQVTAFFNQYAQLIFGLWMVGTFFFALRFAGGYYQVQRLRRRHTVAVPEEFAASLEQLAERMGIRRRVTLMQSRLIDSPLVVGVFKPMVLVPMGMLTGLSSEQIECILTHELAHVRRLDYFVNIMQSMVEILLFFHPAVWWVSKMVREERENACDQVVVDLKENRMVYAHALLNLEVMRSKRPQLALGANGGKLFLRIQRITGGESTPKRPYTRGLFLGLFSLILILLLTTTSKEQIKASMPFLSDVPPELQFSEDQTPQNESALVSDSEQDTAQDSEVEVVAVEEEVREDAYSFAFALKDRLNGDGELDLGSLMKMIDSKRNFHYAFANMAHAAVDSPLTKVVIIEDGREVEISFDKDGKIASVSRDGQTVPQSEHAAYQERMAQIFSSPKVTGYARVSPPAPGAMPGMPPMPKIGKLPPMPPIPNIDFKDMPSPPAPPENMEEDEAARERYEEEMEAYEDSMEAWAERFEEQFEEGEWANFEEQMEAWGEQVEEEFDDGRWDEFGERMEVWAEGFAERFSDENEARISGEWEGSAENWEEFAERMEQMGEEIAAQFENQDWDEFGREMERLGERIEKEVEREMRGLEKELQQMEKELHIVQGRAHHKEKERLERESNAVANGVDFLRRELDRDGLANEGESFKLKINEDDMYINGQKQARSVHKKYVRILEDRLNIPVNEDDVQINFKKRSKSEKMQIER